MKCAVSTLYLEADKKKKVSVDVVCHIICIYLSTRSVMCMCHKKPFITLLDRYR